MFGVVVRMLFVRRNNEAIGYAIYKSKMFFQEERNRFSKFSKLIDQ